MKLRHNRLRNFLAGAGLGLLGVGITAAPVAISPAFAQAAELPWVADLADRLLPSVVEITVETHEAGANPGLQMPDIPDNSPFKDFFDDFFKRQQQGQDNNLPPRTMTSMGSGFVVDSSG